MNLPIFITERDARRLALLIRAYKAAKGSGEVENLERLEQELLRARIVPETELPEGVITMNSIVELEDLSEGDVLTYTLVFPESADAVTGRISILAPLGMAMLGYRVGDEFAWPVPDGVLRVRVRRLLGRISVLPYKGSSGLGGLHATPKANSAAI